MKLLPLWILALLLVNNLPIAFGEGGELGNAFVPFDSKIGGFRLEYEKKWMINDLSGAVSFAEAASESGELGSYFLVVAPGEGGPADGPALLQELRKKFPQLVWKSARIDGVDGLESTTPEGQRLIHLLRAPGDLISLRMQAKNGRNSEEVIDHMLSTFRVH